MGTSTNTKRITNAHLAFQMDADKATKQLLKLATLLHPDTEIQPAERRSANPLQRIPLSAIEIAVRIMQSNPNSFYDFDVVGARDAIAYERAMSAVAATARKLADDLDTSILKRRSVAMRQTLAMYASLKGIARVKGAMHNDARALRDIVATHVGRNAASKLAAQAKKATAPAAVAPKPAPVGASDVAANASPTPPVVH